MTGQRVLRLHLQKNGTVPRLNLPGLAQCFPALFRDICVIVPAGLSTSPEQFQMM
jgi:hypothetical protein